MAIAGVGAQLKRSNMDSVPTFTAIGNITDINGPNMSRGTYDTTQLDTTGGYRTFIGGFRDGGEVVLDMNWEVYGYDDMLDDFESDDARDYQIVMPDDGATTLAFSAIVTAISMKIPTDEKVSSSVTLKVSGQPTLTS
jgi:predicted secreted protein